MSPGVHWWLVEYAYDFRSNLISPGVSWWVLESIENECVLFAIYLSSLGNVLDMKDGIRLSQIFCWRLGVDLMYQEKRDREDATNIQLVLHMHRYKAYSREDSFPYQQFRQLRRRILMVQAWCPLPTTMLVTMLKFCKP